MVDVFSCCQVIFLAIKPQAVHDLANSTQELIQNHHCIISMLAGVSQRTLHGLFKPAKIVRIMPNTPAKLMKGVTGILFDSNSSTHEKEWVTRLCQSFGQVIALGSDDEMNVITAISGSGPAFFYRMVESMIRFGESFGLKPAVATQAAIHTIVGAGSMLLDDPHPADQVKRVASSKGTTQAGLDMMDLQNFDTIMLTVLNRTYERAVELSKEAPC